MECHELERMGFGMTRCDVMQHENKLVFHCCALRVDPLGSVEDQIVEFLDGKTHGESVLHALYDHILDEPIPGRMRALFRAGSAD
jgi:hypothetical protein